MSKRSLSRQDQGVRQYLNLKKDLENESDDISLSLPRFIRIMFFDSPNSWVQEINRFNFVRLASLHHGFGVINAFITLDVGYCNSVYPKNHKNHVEIDLDTFFNTQLIEIKGTKYSLIEFIWSICYNGSIHMIPDKKYENYELIYSSFLEPHPEIAYNLMFEIGKVLIEIFDEFHETLLGNNNAISNNMNFQPLIIREGVMLDGSYFKKSFLQIPLRFKKNKGLRICLDIKLEEQYTNNIIFECGHINSKLLRMKLLQNQTHLIFTIINEDKVKTLSTDISNSIGSYINIELAVYPSGKSILAIGGILKDSSDIEGKVSIPDGKLIIGSNLNASIFGEFYNNTLVIQSIDSFNNLRNLNVYGRKILNIINTNVAYNEIKRPFL